jgi:hypothetical protein
VGTGTRSAETQAELKKIQEETAKAEAELRDAVEGAAIDAIGIIDPTPISDAIGAARSVAQGDWIGAGLSVISMIPYAGDAVGKTAKGARVIKRIADIKKKIGDNVLRARKAITDALKKDAAAIRARRAAQKAEKIEDSVVSGCKVGGNKFGTQSPKEGWVKGERGDGLWDPKQSGLNKDRVAEIEGVTGGKPLKFKDGYPDFSDYVHKSRAPDGSFVESKVEIGFSKHADPDKARAADFSEANKAMREKIPDWKQPEGYTWHHKEDGTTMELVSTELHGNVPHTGGHSIAKEGDY